MDTDRAVELSVRLGEHAERSRSAGKSARWPSTSCTSKSSPGEKAAASRELPPTARASGSMTIARARVTTTPTVRTSLIRKSCCRRSLRAGRTSTGRERSALWNAVEQAGQRRNARLAREVLVTLPPELAQAERTELARKCSRELADRYGSAVDLAVHEPRAGSDERHHHAHLLMTAREVRPG